MRTLVVRLALAALVPALLSCGEDEGDGLRYEKGVFQSSSELRARCEAPRSAVNPRTGEPYPDRQGSMLAEKLWLRSWTYETYLWYREVPDVDPAEHDSATDYFQVLKTSALTDSGMPKDRFHFSVPTEEWHAATSGIEAGYGARWSVLRNKPPRQVVVAYTEPGSPAEAAGLERGDELLAVDGVDLINATESADVAALNAGLYPEQLGEAHRFVIRPAGSTSTREVELVSAEVKTSPVQAVRTIETAFGNVGYLLFNDHIATAESGLIQAISELRSQSVTDLVLDIRYNSGGYLAVASELAYMIAGDARTAGKAFEHTVFNDKSTSHDPVTGEPLKPLPFFSTAVGLSVPAGQALPTLNLGRVFVLTGGGTCSASESIINGLRGAGVEVVQIGGTTCGKPFGFYPTDNCGTTYFTIQFRVANHQGFGEFDEGFAPAHASASTAPAQVPGCSVFDDLSHHLGDPREARLAAALRYRLTPGCTGAPSGVAPANGLTASFGATDGVIRKSPFLENRILWRPLGDP